MSFGVVPARADSSSPDRARELLAETGAVIITGLAPTADALVAAAAFMLGHRLRQVFPYRSRPTRDSGPVHLHADGFDVVVDVGGVPSRRRDPDEDYVFIQAAQAPTSGGESLVIDAYRLADDCRQHDPELWDFLTGTDVDLYGAWANLRGLPAAPRVGRHIEYTRTGRRIVRRTEGALPLHRDPDADWIREMLGRLVAGREPAASRRTGRSLLPTPPRPAPLLSARVRAGGNPVRLGAARDRLGRQSRRAQLRSLADIST